MLKQKNDCISTVACVGFEPAARGTPYFTDTRGCFLCFALRSVAFTIPVPNRKPKPGGTKTYDRKGTGGAAFPIESPKSSVLTRWKVCHFHSRWKAGAINALKKFVSGPWERSGPSIDYQPG